MQPHVCLLLVVVVVVAAAASTSVQGDPRNSTEELAIPVPDSDGDFASPSQVGSDYTSTREPYGGSESESSSAAPLIASGSPDSGALQLPEEVGDNGGETSVSGFPLTAVLTRNTQRNPGTPEGTRGSHTSRQAFPLVTSSPATWTLPATPAGTTGTVYHQELGRSSSSGMEVFEKSTSGPVWGSMSSQTDSSQSIKRSTRMPDATEGTSRIFSSLWTTRNATIASGRLQNSSGSEDGRKTPTFTPTVSTMNLGGTEDEMETPNYIPHVRVLGGSREDETGTLIPSSYAITVLASDGVLNSSGSEGHIGMPRYTPQVGVINLGFSEDGSVTPGHSTQVSTVMVSDPFLNLGGSQEWMEASGHTAQDGLLNLGGSKDTTGTTLVSTVFVSGSEDSTGTPQSTPWVGILNRGVSQEETATPVYTSHTSTILESTEVPKLPGGQDGMRTPGPTPQVGVSSFGGSKDGTTGPRNSTHTSTVSVSREVLRFGGSRDSMGMSTHLPHANTDNTHQTTPTPTTLKNLPSVSPSVLEVPSQDNTTTAPLVITQRTPKTGTRDGNTVTTRHPILKTQSGSTSLSGTTTRIPKVYVVSDQPAAFRVESIEVLLQIVVVESSSASGPDLEKDTIAWVEPYLQRAPGFNRMSGVWGSGRAVQMLLEFESVGALRWLSASGASTLLHQTGLDEAERLGRSFRGSKVINITLGGVQSDICDWLLACPGGFRCVSRPNNSYSCSSVCHFDFCFHHGVCTHHPGQLPVCRCLVGDDFWFMGSRCDVRMTRTRLVCTCVSILALAVALIGSLAVVAVRRYRAALIQAKVDQTRSSYRRFNHFDELSSRFWLRSGSADSVDNPAFTRSDELLHMRALDRPCCYHDDTLSLASASASSACTGRVARLNTIYPDSSQYGWRGSELSVGDGVLDSGKASDLSVCSWPVEPIHWTPFPLLRQLAATHAAHTVRVPRPRSYCEGMELVDMNRSWTA
ncbi:mucin-5AC [Syngnathoides biaculeatus]|uniref:mucin-5AC n=1 Tax=Syngnathoides biaculeatus TaxID=300417 RepID=UPI002ADD9F77|nr:mucin-5AC [Syngnathoides biaculeatus]